MNIFKKGRQGDQDVDLVGGLSEEDIQKVREALRSDFGASPPAIGVVGVSGTGKSSLINAMFKTRLEISHTRACTKEFRANELSMKLLRGPAKDEPISLMVVDAPGLGEDLKMDPPYLQRYAEELPACDAILWVMTARYRAVSLDQQYLQKLVQFHDRIIFGLNQVDLVHPMDWNDDINLPSVEMEANIADIVQDRTQKIADVIGREPELIPFSASRGYNLEMVFRALMSSAPPTRRFIFDLLKGFSYKDFIPAAISNLVNDHD